MPSMPFKKYLKLVPTIENISNENFQHKKKIFFFIQKANSGWPSSPTLCVVVQIHIDLEFFQVDSHQVSTGIQTDPDIEWVAKEWGRETAVDTCTGVVQVTNTWYRADIR